jgi:hypothetical protein
MVSLVGVAGCGGSDQPTATEDGPPGSTATADAVADSGAVSSATTAASEASVPVDPDDGDATSSDSGAYAGLQPGPNEFGQCRVDVTGAETVSWDAGGGYAATLVDYWLTEAERELLGTDVFGLIINCTSEFGYVGFTAADAADSSTVPLAPGRYELPPASAGLEVPNPIRGGIDIEGSEAVWGLSQPGVLDITAFDEARIAGTFSFVTTDVLGDVSGELQVTGSFDFKNPNG